MIGLILTCGTRYHHPRNAAIAAIIAAAAVSVRSIVGPSDAIAHPALRAMCNSSPLKLPSGPMAIAS